MTNDLPILKLLMNEWMNEWMNEKFIILSDAFIKQNLQEPTLEGPAGNT